MSDRQKHVILPPRGHISETAGGILNCPGAYKLTKLGEIHYSGICVFRSLVIWQDDISKQVFWWAGDTGNIEIYPNNDNEPIFQCFVLIPSCLEMFRYFLLGWGVEYHYSDPTTEEREQLFSLIKSKVEECEQP